MQRYTEQLIKDLHNAKNKHCLFKMHLPPKFVFVQGVEEYLYGEMYEL
ncbi:MAG: hypothetical protein L3J74_04995 [Bacteroidales bacterium]|nr:hypothetical protein [Bacteroidales bacterium]